MAQYDMIISSRQGFTTGSAATAASVAALMDCKGLLFNNCVSIILPDKQILSIKVFVNNGVASVIKVAGDDPDVTNGIIIQSSVELTSDGVISITGGAGVGKVTKRGLQIPVGESAINPVPKQMIEENLRQYLDVGEGAKVTITVPDGIAIAKKTFNERLGIVGGISIIGSSGIVKPMSVDALKQTIACEIDVYHAEGANFIWLVPGRLGEKALLSYQKDAVTVQMSNYVGFALDKLKSKNYKSIGIAGHPGKLAKIAMGYYDTHSNVSPQAHGFIKDLFGLSGDFNTVEEIVLGGYRDRFDELAKIISSKVIDDFGFNEVNVMLFSMEGALVGRYINL